MKSRLPLSLSILSLMISLAAIFLAYFRCEPIKTDWATFLVTILAGMVALLIGWQFLNALEINKKISTFEGVFDEKMQIVIKDSNHVAAANEYKLSAYEIISLANDPAIGIYNVIKAINEACKITTPGANEYIINSIMETANELIKSYTENNKELKISESQKNEYITIAKKVEHKDAVNLIKYLSQATE